MTLPNDTPKVAGLIPDIAGDVHAETGWDDSGPLAKLGDTGRFVGLKIVCGPYVLGLGKGEYLVPTGFLACCLFFLNLNGAGVRGLLRGIEARSE